ncbi:ribbon-helix-helix protein, CopG family [Methanofollis formosanus]|uniref:Ribbon-helix-helix protein, CopG family n=1 Tax=Methanofollis formosanus TaxID=299308 RepID=A0A8G1EHL6_9EURY|nr:ribbon-helix-helix protein, CopG family [Methanofollis formosanus]QYZ80132.1 ribbon-helix-helix protein, CopG family [Methanofollis formosanus]
MTVFSVSMDDSLVARVDDAVAREGAASRSAWLEMVAAERLADERAQAEEWTIRCRELEREVSRLAAEQGKLVEEVGRLRGA